MHTHGPRQSMMVVSSTFPGFAPILPTTPSTFPFRFSTTDAIAIAASPTSMMKNPMNPLIQLLPVSLPRNGGKIRFPAPNCAANNASPMQRVAENLLLFFSIFSPYLLTFITNTPPTLP